MYSKKTRCPHCQTLYRVTIDQLTISHGQVLCGDCQLMFNAIEHLCLDDVKCTGLPSQVTSQSTHTATPYHAHSSYMWEEDVNAMSHPEVVQFFQQKTPHSPVTLLEYLNKLGE